MMKTNQQIIVRKIWTKCFLVVFIFYPFFLMGQIESSKMIFLLNNTFYDDVFCANELNYYTLECFPSSHLPRVRKGKHFCQTEYSKTKYGTKTVYEYTKKYFAESKRLECILYFTIDSLSRDTIKKSKEIYCYEKGLLKYIINKEIIDKIDKYTVHGDKVRNVLYIDTTYIHYDFISNNEKKGYYYSSDDNDTNWFHYKWKKVNKSSYELINYSVTGELEMYTKLNNEDFYQYKSIEPNLAHFKFGTFYSDDSIVINNFEPPSISFNISPNVRPFYSSRLIYEDTIVKQITKMYSMKREYPYHYVTTTKKIKLNNSRMPIMYNEKIVSVENEVFSKTINFIYSYEVLIE